jgi:hypothetical protein
MSSVLGEAAAHPALHLVPQRRPRTLIEATPTSLRCRQKQRPGLRSALDRLATHPRAVHRRGILMRCPLYLSHQARPRATANPAARANHGQTRGKNLGASCLPMPALCARPQSARPAQQPHAPRCRLESAEAGRGGRAKRQGLSRRAVGGGAYPAESNMARIGRILNMCMIAVLCGHEGARPAKRRVAQ